MQANLYQAYRRNPALREELERRARDLRAAEMDRLVFVPIAAWIRRCVAAMHATPPSYQA